MKHRNLAAGALALAAAFLLTAAPARALGPIDGEFGAIWWANEFDSAGGAAGISEDSGAPAYRAEIWFVNKVGLRAAVYNADLEDIGAENSDQASVDVLWKVFAPSENNFLAVGAGWQELDLEAIGMADGTSGPRAALEGRIGIVGLLYAYGQGSYYFEHDDADAMVAADGRFSDIDGHEYEVGVFWKMFPFVNMRAGFRASEIGFTRVDAVGTSFDGTADTEGWFAGVGIHF